MKINRMFILALTISVVAFTSCSAGQANAPSGMKRLSNEYADYNMFVPEAWVIVSDDNTGYSSAYYSESDRSNVTVTSFDENVGYASLDDFWADYEEEFQSTFSDMEYVSNEKTTLSGYEAKAVEYTATVTNAQYKYMQLVCIRGGYVYLITYTAAVENYDDHIDTVWAMINEFTFK